MSLRTSSSYSALHKVPLRYKKKTFTQNIKKNHLLPLNDEHTCVLDTSVKHKKQLISFKVTHPLLLNSQTYKNNCVGHDVVLGSWLNLYCRTTDECFTENMEKQNKMISFWDINHFGRTFPHSTVILTAVIKQKQTTHTQIHSRVTQIKIDMKVSSLPMIFDTFTLIHTVHPSHFRSHIFKIVYNNTCTYVRWWWWKIGKPSWHFWKLF